MNFPLVLGFLLLSLGLMIVAGRLFDIKPLQFRLEFYQRAMGEKHGSLMHLALYGLGPAVLGVLLISRHWPG